MQAPQLLRVADRVDTRDATLDRFVHGLAERRPRARDPRPAVQRFARCGHATAAVRRPDDIWVEHRHEPLEVALGNRHREGSHGAIVLVARGLEAERNARELSDGHTVVLRLVVTCDARSRRGSVVLLKRLVFVQPGRSTHDMLWPHSSSASWGVATALGSLRRQLS